MTGTAPILGATSITACCRALRAVANQQWFPALCTGTEMDAGYRRAAVIGLIAPPGVRAVRSWYRTRSTARQQYQWRNGGSGAGGKYFPFRHERAFTMPGGVLYC